MTNTERLQPSEGPLNFQQLCDQLPEMNMTENLSLVAVSPTGVEYPASVEYSSDLGCMAILQYSGDGNIRSWIPLPTRKTVYGKGGATSTYVVHDYIQSGFPATETRFRLAKSRTSKRVE